MNIAYISRCWLLLILFCCMFSVHRSSAGTADSGISRYSMRHYTDEDGLPQNSIRAIRQDEYGFIWLATEDGLTRFDGKNFLVYNNTNLNVTSNRFSNIWNSIYGGGLCAYTLNDEYVRIKNGSAMADKAYTIYNHQLFPLLMSYGIMLNDKVPENLELYPWGDHRFYAYRNEMIYSFRDNKLEFRMHYAARDSRYERFFVVNGTLYHCDSTGKLISFEDGHVRSIQITGDIERNRDYPYRFSQLHALANNSGNTGLFQLGKAIYIGEQQADHSFRTKLVIDDFDFENNRISSAFYDRQHEIVFLGSVINGLYVLQKNKFRTVKVGKDEVGNDYYALTPYDSSSVVTPNGNFINTEIQRGHVFGVGKINYNLYTILTDRQGYIWHASYTLNRYTRDFRLAGKWSLKDEKPIVLYQSLAGPIWAATREGKILSIDPSVTDSVSQLPVVFPGISYIVQENLKTTWIATSHGLFRLHMNNMQVDTIYAMNGKYVRSLYMSRPGQLWITTYSHGFFLYENGSITDFPEDEGHFLNAAHCIVEDNRGYFWITTNKGLFQVAKKDLLAYASGSQHEVFYLYYGKTNGFGTNEFNGGCEPCGLKLADGNIVLPSLNGMVWVEPQSLKEELPDGQIFIDRILLNDRVLPVTNNIELGQHTVPLNISVSTPYFGDRRNVHMYYQLTEDGKDAAYMPVPASGTVSLQNLSSGKYVLTICKMNGFGKDNYARKIITITVPPFWYQTGWFYTAAALLLLGLVYLFISLRTRYLINKNRMLEIVIRKRTHNLEQALHSLETSQSAQAKQTYIQERLVAAISHDIRTPLKYLSFSNRKIYQLLVSQQADNEILEISKSAADAATRMHHYLGNLLQYVKTSLKKGNVKADVFNLFDLVSEHVAMFADAAQHNNTVIQNNVASQPEIYANRQLLAIILHNILDNAVKNTFNGLIDITAVTGNGSVNIIIADNGSGIPATLQEWVNSDTAAFESDGTINPIANTGMGLFIVKELSALIKAKLYIASDNATGTAVHIILEQ